MSANVKRFLILIDMKDGTTSQFIYGESAQAMLAVGHRIIAVSEMSNSGAPRGVETLEVGSTFGAACNSFLKQSSIQGYDIVILGASLSPTLEDLLLIQEVLYAADKHTVASPRINDGSFLELKQPTNGMSRNDLLDLSRSVLPEYSRVPFASGALSMIKSEVLCNFEFFDKKYRSPFAAVADLCMRVGDYGYSSVMANHVMIELHNPLPKVYSQDEKLLQEKWPLLPKLETHYLNNCRHPADRFFDLLLPHSYEKKKILFEFSSMPPFHCGTSELQLALLKYFFERYWEKYEIDIRVSREAAEFHRLDCLYPSVHYNDEDLGRYHLGFCAAQPTDIQQQFYLNEHCLKIVYTMLDVIMLRCNYLMAGDWEREDVVRFGLETSDAIIAISDFSRDDYSALFSASPEVVDKPVRVVRLATDFGKCLQDEETNDITIPFERFSLIVGNSHKHKALEQTIDAIGAMEEKFIVIGTEDEGYQQPNTYGIPTAKLSESFLCKLYSLAQIVVFPSLYEGFGLPVAIALKQGKSVIVNNNAVNRELVEVHSDLKSSFIFFSCFSEIPHLITKFKNEKCTAQDSYNYSWCDAIIRIEEYIDEVISFPVSSSKLQQRWNRVKLLQGQMEKASNSVGLKKALSRRVLRGRLGKNPLIQKAFKAMLAAKS